MTAWERFFRGADAPTDRTDYFWGTPTALINWCESDYALTGYIAEFWNTISNSSFLLMSGVGLYFGMFYGYEKRYWVAQAMTVLIGLGSAAFHATLRYEMQLLDEIPMLYGISALVYCWLNVCNDTVRQRWLHIVILSCLSTLATVMYIFAKDPFVHHAAFTIGVWTVIIRSLMFCNAWQKRFNTDAEFRENMLAVTTTPAPLKSLKRLLLSAMFGYLTAVAFWSVDKLYCHVLESHRQSVSLYFPFLAGLLTAPSQFHAWWHIIVAWATHVNIMGVCFARELYLAMDSSRLISVQWRWFLFPVVHIEKVKKVENISSPPLKPILMAPLRYRKFE